MIRKRISVSKEIPLYSDTYKKVLVYTFGTSLILITDLKNRLLCFKGQNSKVGYFRLHQEFKKTSLRKAIKINNPKALFIEKTNLKHLGKNVLNLNNYIGLDVFKSDLISNLKVRLNCGYTKSKTSIVKD